MVFIELRIEGFGILLGTRKQDIWSLYIYTELYTHIHTMHKYNNLDDWAACDIQLFSVVFQTMSI